MSTLEELFVGAIAVVAITLMLAALAPIVIGAVMLARMAWHDWPIFRRTK